jgi:hypothetical protein
MAAKSERPSRRSDEGSGVKAARISSAEVEHAKSVAEKAGLRLTALEKRPDGTVKLEFGEYAVNDDWRDGSPLYGARQ